MSTTKRKHSDQLDTEINKKLKSSNILPFIPSDFIASRARNLCHLLDVERPANHAMHYAQVLAVLHFICNANLQ